MKRTVFVICSIIFITSCLFAQKYEPVTIKAGTSIKDYFPVAERYLYPNFTAGKGYFKKGIVIPCLFNFNVLSGEMEFIQSKDTLIIAKKEEINSIVVATDTFYYHDAYLQMIRSGRLSVYVKRGIEIKNILKQGAMGTINRSAASDSYSFVLIGQRSFDMKLAEDVVIQQKVGYFYSTSGNDFIPFTRKNIIRIMQGKEGEIKNYIKSNKIDFESREDLLKLAGFVSDLIFKNPGKP
ncbi:MAG TPA: hypothetical protein VIK55_18125 [Paludibacter sp.]